MDATKTGYFTTLIYGDKRADSRFKITPENADDIEDQAHNAKYVIQRTLNVVPNFMSASLGGKGEPSKELMSDVTQCLAELADLAYALDRLEEEARSHNVAEEAQS